MSTEIGYDVEREVEFARKQLGATIPDKLNELLARVEQCRARVEDWYADLIIKISLSIGRVCIDLFKTTQQDALPAAAWNARNLLELWVWVKYCSGSRENARRFYEDAIRDAKGIADMHSKMCQAAGVTDEFGAASQQKLKEIAAERLGLATIDSNYKRIADAAKSLGLDHQYGPMNGFLSKLAHPTAGLVIGIMHQSPELLRGLQASCTTMGMYFAGQCVIVMEGVISTIP